MLNYAAYAFCAVLPYPGIPSESELLQQYCAAVGRPLPTPQAWGFYLALSLFRLLAILAGVQVSSIRIVNVDSLFWRE